MLDATQYLRTVVIMRGIPGSGKSYLAKELLYNLIAGGMNAVIHSTDDFFMKDGEYKWNGNQVHFAHKWNQKRTEDALKANTNVVIVDNTNTTWKEIKPYVDMAKANGYRIMVLESATPWCKDVEECTKKNQHNVPRESIERMLARWEDTETFKDKL